MILQSLGSKLMISPTTAAWLIKLMTLDPAWSSLELLGAWWSFCLVHTLPEGPTRTPTNVEFILCVCLVPSDITSYDEEDQVLSLSLFLLCIRMISILLSLLSPS